MLPSVGLVNSLISICCILAACAAATEVNLVEDEEPLLKVQYCN